MYKRQGLFTLTEELADQLYPDIENREAVWNVHTSEDSDALRAVSYTHLDVYKRQVVSLMSYVTMLIVRKNKKCFDF